MNYRLQQRGYAYVLTILLWGSLWGLFEAVFGYLLHLLPYSIGWLIWVPVACFFMSNVYRKTGRISSILLIGVLCSCIKLTNLFLPGRIDRVLNPAISILMEAAALAITVYVAARLAKKQERAPSPLGKAMLALGMNTGWRLLYALYLFILVPDWMREISVISSMEKFIPFFFTQNLMTSALLFLGYHNKRLLFRPLEQAEEAISSLRTAIPTQQLRLYQTGAVMLLLCLNVTLEFIL
jgi:hypothetical protein